MWSNINKIKRKLNRINNNFLKIYNMQLNKLLKNKLVQKKNKRVVN